MTYLCMAMARPGRVQEFCRSRLAPGRAAPTADRMSAGPGVVMTTLLPGTSDPVWRARDREPAGFDKTLETRPGLA